MSKAHKRVADSFIGVAEGVSQLSLGTDDPNAQVYKKFSDTMEKLRKIEGRVSTDTDLKLTDLLRYYERDSKAALDLLYRRLRSMVDLENAKKTHEKAKIKGKDVPTAEKNEEKCQTRVELSLIHI